MGVVKTAAGIFCLAVAKEAFKASNDMDDPSDQLGAMAVGSVAGSAAYHLLKDDVKDLVRDKDQKLLENS